MIPKLDFMIFRLKNAVVCIDIIPFILYDSKMKKAIAIL